MKYRKRPVVVEAVRVTAADYNGAADDPWDGNPFSEPAPAWLFEAVRAGVLMAHNRGSTDYASWDIKTLEGTMTAGPGDWIVRGINGELYPIKPDIFAATYEPVAAEAAEKGTPK